MSTNNLRAHIISFSSNSSLSSFNIVFPDSRSSDTYTQSIIQHVKELIDFYAELSEASHGV
ncbi:hypothetical protein Fmac_024760 [Flemingia macrophylla]|uniref:Uncharacterized protein n=1 Tax=Flemingia macrophylla TaxID=520843 RepID=A0ABD1LQA1_9FABA